MEHNVFDVIIIGGGAAGLFAAAALPKTMRVLVIEKNKQPGRKLLMSGNGQCNLTYDVPMRDFVGRYGDNGKRIRTALYSFGNDGVREYFSQHGVPTYSREDHKVFPVSMKSSDVLAALVSACSKNNVEFQLNSPVTGIEFFDWDEGDINNTGFTVHSEAGIYQGRHLIVATGGKSYPGTGSDGSFFNVLCKLGLTVTSLRPALTPVYPKDYPYGELTGISIPDAEISILCKSRRKNRGSLLFTDRTLSGPVILDLSRHIENDCQISCSYLPSVNKDAFSSSLKKGLSGQKKQASSFAAACITQAGAGTQLPKRFIDTLLFRAGIDPAEKASSVSGSAWNTFISLIFSDVFTVERTGGFSEAMATAGGVSLDDMNLKTFQAHVHPKLFIIGEALDIDGDTGGFNLQFAFSSAHAAAKAIIV